MRERKMAIPPVPPVIDVPILGLFDHHQPTEKPLNRIVVIANLLRNLQQRLVKRLIYPSYIFGLGVTAPFRWAINVF